MMLLIVLMIETDSDHLANLTIRSHYQHLMCNGLSNVDVIMLVVVNWMLMNSILVAAVAMIVVQMLVSMLWLASKNYVLPGKKKK